MVALNSALQLYERIDAALLFKKSKTAFGHREEAVRDAMVHFGGFYHSSRHVAKRYQCANVRCHGRTP